MRLEVHIDGVNMYCNICRSSFGNIALFFRHLILFHSNFSAYTCAFTKCSRRFVSIPTLKKHMSQCERNDQRIVTKAIDFDVNNSSKNIVENGQTRSVVLPK